MARRVGLPVAGRGDSGPLGARTHAHHVGERRIQRKVQRGVESLAEVRLQRSHDAVTHAVNGGGGHCAAAHAAARRESASEWLGGVCHDIRVTIVNIRRVWGDKIPAITPWPTLIVRLSQPLVVRIQT